MQHLPHYWESLPGDSPLKAKYAQPAAAETGSRLALAVVAVVGVVMAVTGTVLGGLLLAVAGGVGAVRAHRRIEAAGVARASWERKQICLACTHLWVP